MINMTREEFIKWYNQLMLQQLCKHLDRKDIYPNGIVITTLKHYYEKGVS